MQADGVKTDINRKSRDWPSIISTILTVIVMTIVVVLATWNIPGYRFYCAMPAVLATILTVRNRLKRR